MAEECGGKCDKHEDTMIEMKSYKFIVTVCSTLALLFLIPIIVMAWSTRQEIHNHKLLALERYSEVENQMVGFNGYLNAMNIHLSNVKDDTQEMKETMKSDTAELKELIKGINTSFVADADKLDTSMILVNEL